MTGAVEANGARFTAHYEAVRALALGEPANGVTPLGFAVLLRRGLVAWLASCAEAVARQAAPAPRPRSEGVPVAPIVGGLRGEAVRVLASMALAAAGKGDS